MGIRGLTSLIKKYVPNSVKIRPFGYFKNSIIAIDTSILLYKFKYSNSGNNSHITGFLNKCLSYIKHGICPVFICDGKPPPEKNTVLLKRNKQRQKIGMRIKELEDSNNEDKLHQIQKLNKQLVTVTKEHRTDTNELLECLGFCVINSPGEAETVCAFLQNNNTVDFTYSDDTDLLTLGCKKVLRSSANRLNSFVEIDLDNILEGLKLNMKEFIDLCILCGCDYCSTIPKINYTVAYELITQHRDIETVLENIKDTYTIPDNFNYESARNIFNMSSKMDIKVSISSPKINEEKLYKFLYSKNYTKKYIDDYIKIFNNSIKLN